MADVTRILNAIEHGDAKAADELLPLVYEELRFLAAQRLSREKPGQTLQATALVHEAYIRLVEGADHDWNNRGHFFIAAAEAMRRILIENARRKNRIRHGGSRRKVRLDEVDLITDEPNFDILALDESLEQLAKDEKTIATLVKLRFYAGLTLEQAAKTLKISRRTANRYWIYAKAYLYKEIQQE